MTIMVHLGHGATGAGAVQAAIRRQARVVAAAGLVLPAYAMRPGGGEILARAIRQGDNPTIAGCLADISAAARSVPGGAVLVGADGFRTLGPRQMTLLAGALGLTGLPVRAAAYLRPQAALWNTLYGESARRLRVLPGHRLWAAGGYAGPGLVAGFDYDRLTRRLARLFGRGNLMLRRGDGAGSDQGMIVDLVETAQPGASASLPRLARAARPVPAIGWKGVALAIDRASSLRWERAAGLVHGPDWAARQRRALAITLDAMAAGGDGAWLGREASAATPAERRAIAAAYAAGNAAVLARHRLAPGFLDEPAAPPAEPCRLDALAPDEREEALERFAEALAPASPPLLAIPA